MYVDVSTVTTSSGKKHKRVLLRESYREKGKVKKRTLANLTALPDTVITVIKSMVGKRAPHATLVDIHDVAAHAGLKFGSFYVLYTFITRMGIAEALGSCREALLIVWLICARILFQGSRLKASRLGKQYAVQSIVGLSDFNEDSLYRAMDWLSERQQDIEDYLIKRKGNDTKGLYLYDVTSCYFEGHQNQLSDYGYNRDGKKGKKQIVVGLLTDVQGEPLSSEVFPGNTTDPKTCSKRIEDIKRRFAAEAITLVGDRGMIKEPQIKELLRHDYNYITAITKPQIQKLLAEEVLQLSLFDEELQEIVHDSVRYVLRRNPQRAEEIQKSRSEKLAKLKGKAEQRTKYLKEHPRAHEQVALRHIMQWASKLKIDKWVNVSVEDRVLRIEVDKDKLREDSKLDGCYVVKSNLTEAQMITAQQIHDRYKDLTQVQWAFRTLKTTLLENRPIYHRLEKRTRAVCFISMLAYKVARQMTAQLSEHTDELLKLMFKNKSDAAHQVLPLEDIISELDLIQETKLDAGGVQIPVILKPSAVGEKVLSILKIKLPSTKSP